MVVKNWLDDDDTRLITVAGNGSQGSTLDALNSPCGIFVDINLNLYVADSLNHRIQMFSRGHLHGITIAGSTSVNTTIGLNHPKDLEGVGMDGCNICCYCYRYYRRTQAEERFLRRVEMAAAQGQPRIIYHVQPISVPLLQESAPPTYEQIVFAQQNTV
ncbi:hypothetical protein I4U23_022408 [Adineta vaga]|nr:hypothetical protein I4U23_022408 [Adineta vaga]